MLWMPRILVLGFLMSLSSLAGAQTKSTSPSMPNPSTYELAINCGSSEAHVTPSGRVYGPDRPYGSGPLPYRGHVDGVLIRTQIAVSGVEDETLYRSARVGFREYRFDVPFPGLYLVKLHFNELLFQGRGQNVFSLDLEGQTVLSSFDIWDLVLKDYALDYVFPVEVSDGTLNIVMNTETGPGTLCAVSVLSSASDAIAPSSPSGAQALGSYRRNILTWNQSPEDDVIGYNVYRLFAGGVAVKLNNETIRTRRYLDDSVQVAVTANYVVTAVDAWGNESAESDLMTAVALDPSASTLPVYELTVDPSDIDMMNDLWFENVFVPAEFRVDGQVFAGSETRYRGNFSRLNAKKSWKVNLDSGLDLDGRDRINLNSMSTDTGMLREKLGMDLFQSVGIPAANTRFAHLQVNGHFQGVFLDIENMGNEFVERVGLNTDGTLYRGDDILQVLPDAWTYDAEYERESNQGGGVTDIVQLIEWITYLSDDDFAAAAHQILDLEEIATYYAMVVLIGRNDFTYSDYYLFLDTATRRWQMLPWDNDETFGLIGGARDGYEFRFDLPIDFGTADSSEIAGGDRPNWLLTRCARIPEFRQYFCEQLSFWILNWFKPSVMDPAIDSVHQSIAFDGLRDLLKWKREDSSVFLGAVDELKSFVANRGPFLLGEIPGYCPVDGPYVSLNELMPVNTVTRGDEAGEFDPWFEMFNATLTPVDLSGYYVTDDPAQLTKWQIPSGVTLPPSSWTLFWSDGDLGQGLTHTPSLLSANGGELLVVDRSGSNVVSRLSYGALGNDVAHGVLADGGAQEGVLGTSSPAFANYRLPTPPTISQVSRDVDWPGGGESTVVTARVSDDSSVSQVLLTYRVDDQVSFVPMLDDGASGDGAVGDGIYGGLLPGQPSGTVVRYYIEATDDEGMSRRDPELTPALVYEFEAGAVPPRLFINEFLAGNTAVNQDEVGDFDDWLEIYNGDSVSVDLSGMYLSDDLSENDKWQIPPGTVLGPGEWLLVWADDEPSEGPLHATFKLSKSGEEIGLFHTDARGRLRIDGIVFGPQLDDVSYGRTPDGGDQWQFFPTPTPGAAN